jgi:hypothetical protein
MSDETKPGADIVADAREWLARYGGRETTHSDDCHRWHDACLIARLVAECERLSGRVDACRVAGVVLAMECNRLRLTEDEREAICIGRIWMPTALEESAATLRALLERVGVRDE